MDLLDTEKGAQVVELLRVARRWKRPPLTVLAARPDCWRPDDTRLAVALERFENTRVDALGFPTRLSEDEDHEDDWDVDAETVNYAQKALDQWRKDNPEPQPGITPRVVFFPTPTPTT